MLQCARITQWVRQNCLLRLMEISIRGQREEGWLGSSFREAASVPSWSSPRAICPARSTLPLSTAPASGAGGQPPPPRRRRVTTYSDCVCFPSSSLRYPHSQAHNRAHLLQSTFHSMCSNQNFLKIIR